VIYERYNYEMRKREGGKENKNCESPLLASTCGTPLINHNFINSRRLKAPLRTGRNGDIRYFYFAVSA